MRTGLKRSNKQNVSKFSRNMFTKIRCEICINHFVEIIFTLSCAVVDINLLQINCSQNFLLKMCKKKMYRHPLVDINNINVHGPRICSHSLVQIPRADAEIITNKLPLILFLLLICYFCILMLYQRVFLLIFTWKVKGNNFGYLYTNQTYIFFFIWNCRISNSRTIWTII